MITYTIENAQKQGMKVGKNVGFTDTPNFGSEPYLIEIGDNTTFSFEVAFVNHDAATRVIRQLPDGDPNTIIYGKIKIGKNCFIGCRTTLLPGIEIGDNVVIGAGSVVNKSIPSNSIAAGVPCKVICSLDEYREKHQDDFLYMVNLPYNEKKKFLTEHFGD